MDQQFHEDIMNFMSQRRRKWIFIWSVFNFGISCYAIGGGWFAGFHGIIHLNFH